MLQVSNGAGCGLKECLAPGSLMRGPRTLKQWMGWCRGLSKGYCDKGNLLTTVYTVADHPDIMTLKDKLLPVNFIGMNINVKAIYIAPFLSGHRVMVDIGWVAPKDLKHGLGKQEPITLAFKDYKGTAINEYFDIPENAWSNNNLSLALDEAQDMCRKL